MVLAAKAERTPPAQYTTTGRGLVGDPALDLELELAAGKVHRPGDRPLLVLVGLADVEAYDPVSSRRGCTSSAWASRIADLASFNSSRAVATTITTFRSGVGRRRSPPSL